MRPGLDPDVLPGICGIQLNIRCLEGEPASLRHGISRVDDQIHHDLFDLPRIDLYAAEGRIEDGDEVDILPDQWAKHLPHARDDHI